MFAEVVERLAPQGSWRLRDLDGESMG
jgi:hypothetical protein